jgi:hypothetical protein
MYVCIYVYASEASLLKLKYQLAVKISSHPAYPLFMQVSLRYLLVFLCTDM